MDKRVKEILHKKVTSWKSPFYFYDLSIIEGNYKKLQTSLSNRFQIFYSMKSNPHPAILKKLKGLNCLMDISSSGEMKHAFEAGYTGNQISFVGPGKSREELSESIDNNIEYVIIESLQELEVFAELAKEKKKNPKFCLRVSPDKYFHTNGQVKTNAPTHFGFDEKEVLSVKNILEKNPQIKLAGVHFYLQSQYLKANLIVENFKNFVEITLKLQKHFNMKFEMVNFGGGFGIPYFHGQESLDLEELNVGIQEFLKNEQTQLLKDCLFFVESGRFISGPAGFFVTKVLYTKTSHEKKYAICDGGMTQHQSAIGIGQVIRRNFPMEVIKLNDNDSIIEKINLAGPSCYSIDLLGTDVELPKIIAGDFVVIEQSGAYGPTFSPENFLSRPAAHEYTNESE